MTIHPSIRPITITITGWEALYYTYQAFFCLRSHTKHDPF